MNLVPVMVARRYLFSKGNRNVINIISGIAAGGVAIGTFAMVIVLSAFNGLEGLVSNLYTAVDPDIRIAPARGKVFALDTIGWQEINDWQEVKLAAPVLEETVFLQFEGEQSIVSLRGVSEDYLRSLQLDSFVIEGDIGLQFQGVEAAMIGFGIADILNLFIRDGVQTIQVYAAKRDGIDGMNPQSKFVSDRLLPMGIIMLNPEFDYTYIYSSYEFAEALLDYPGQASYLDLNLAAGADADAVKERLQAKLGDAYTVKTRLELNEVLYKTNKTEKWITFFILSFIMVVATFNLVGSLAMLIIEKRRDVSLLRSIGSTMPDMRRLFLLEGLLITGLGTSVGLVLSVTIVLLQQHIGFFPLQGGIVEFYPVELEALDVLAVIGVAFGIGALASLLPTRVLLSDRRLQAITAS